MASLLFLLHLWLLEVTLRTPDAEHTDFRGINVCEDNSWICLGLSSEDTYRHIIHHAFCLQWTLRTLPNLGFVLGHFGAPRILIHACLNISLKDSSIYMQANIMGMSCICACRWAYVYISIHWTLGRNLPLEITPGVTVTKGHKGRRFHQLLWLISPPGILIGLSRYDSKSKSETINFGTKNILILYCVCFLLCLVDCLPILKSHFLSLPSRSPEAMHSDNLLYSASKVAKSLFNVKAALGIKMERLGIDIYSVRTKSVETSWWETGSRNSMLCCHVNPCQQNHFWNPYKCSENLLNHLDPYHFAKRLLCSGVIRIDTLQLTHQGSDLRWLLKNWINKLLEHILRPVGLAQCGKNRFLHCICKNINETLLYSCSA